MWDSDHMGHVNILLSGILSFNLCTIWQWLWGWKLWWRACAKVALPGKHKEMESIAKPISQGGLTTKILLDNNDDDDEYENIHQFNYDSKEK